MLELVTKRLAQLRVTIELVKYNWLEKRRPLKDLFSRRDMRIVTQAEIDEAKNLRDKIEFACKILPFPVLCVPKSLAMQSMLSKRQIPSQIVFGVLPKSMRQAHTEQHDLAFETDQTLSSKQRKIQKLLRLRFAHAWVCVTTNEGDLIVVNKEPINGHQEIFRS